MPFFLNIRVYNANAEISKPTVELWSAAISSIFFFILCSAMSVLGGCSTVEHNIATIKAEPYSPLSAIGFIALSWPFGLQFLILLMLLESSCKALCS
jgi:hypothetical protein